MEHLVGLIGLAIVLFVATNIDDVFVLLGFFADPRFKGRQIVIGQFFGIAALYGASVVASLLSLVIPPAYIGLLGLAPIAIGLKQAWELWKGKPASDEASEGHEKASAGHGNVAAVALVTVANGGDNISIYTPFFATRSGYDIAAIGVLFATMTLLWLGAAHWLTHHRTLGAPIRRYGHRVVPFLLIALGILIVYEAGTIELAASILR
jgi:cadmium resistance protein CadD (predicted permease)